MKTQNNGLCPLCGGKKHKGKTTFTVDMGFGVVVVRGVPAMVCTQCGAEWMDDNMVEKVENIVKDARKKHHTVEVTTFAKTA